MGMIDTFSLFVFSFFADHGKIIKAVNAESADSNRKVSSVVIEELDVLPTSEPIRNLEIIRTTQYGKWSTMYAEVNSNFYWLGEPHEKCSKHWTLPIYMACVSNSELFFRFYCCLPFLFAFFNPLHAAIHFSISPFSFEVLHNGGKLTRCNLKFDEFSGIMEWTIFAQFALKKIVQNGPMCCSVSNWHVR